MPNPYEAKWAQLQAERRERLGLPPETNISPDGEVIPFNHEPGVAEALARIGLAYILTRKTPRGGMSWIDRQQEKIAGLGNAVAGKAGAEKAELSFPENVERVVTGLEQKFMGIIPENYDLIRDLESKIISEAKELTKRVNTGQLDNEYPPTREEKVIAAELQLLLGIRKAKDLAGILHRHVSSRSNDMALARSRAELQSFYDRIHQALEAMQGQTPKVVFIPDLITAHLIMDPGEQTELENTLWGLSPTYLSVSDVRRMKSRGGSPDFKKFPLDKISSGEQAVQDILIQKGSISTFDLLRQKATQFLQPTVNSLQNKLNLSEVMVLVDYEKDEDLARMVVRDADHAIRRIADLALLNRDFIQAEEFARKALFEHEAVYEFPIRPKVVLGLLPQGDLVTEVDIELGKDAQMDYSSPIQRLMEKKRQIEERLFRTAIEASNWVDESGIPTRKSDIVTLNAGRRLIEGVEENITKLRDLIVDQDRKRGVMRVCEYCGQTLEAGSVCSRCGGPNKPENGGETDA